jgi:hypothetical protein
MIRTKTQTATLNLPAYLFSQIADFSEKRSKVIENRIKNPLKNIKFPDYKNTKVAYGALALVVILIIGAGLYFAMFKGNSSADTSNQIVSENGVSAPLNKKLNFPIKDRSGKDTGNQLVVNFTSVERSEKILYKGRPLLPRKSKDFIVINIEIENSTKDRLTVRPADFMRLVMPDGKQFAPDIQTDPIKVEPLSIKRTRTVYIVNDNQRDLKFLIGEINGNRETVEVKI